MFCLFHILLIFFVLVKEIKTVDFSSSFLPPPPAPQSSLKGKRQALRTSLSHHILQATPLTTIKWNHQNIPWCPLFPQWSDSALPFLHTPQGFLLSLLGPAMLGAAEARKQLGAGSSGLLGAHLSPDQAQSSVGRASTV